MKTECCWHKHWAQKHLSCCTRTEKFKRFGFATICYLGMIVIIAAMYALSTFRWSL